MRSPICTQHPITLLYNQKYLMLEKAVEILKEFEATKGATLTYQSLGIVEKRPGCKEIRLIQRPAYVSGTLAPGISEEKVASINEKAEEKEIYLDLDVPLETGKPFNNYGEIDNVFDDGKTELSHKPGEVLLVDVWATWCGPCQKPMAHNQEMLQKNQELWKGKVRIVGVSVDQSKETVKQRVESKNWNKVIHLTLLGWKHDSQLIKDFKIQGIPFVCLVDKFGKTNFIGHPMSINLETRINELLAKEKEDDPGAPAVSAGPQEVNITEEEIQKIASSFTKEKLENDLKDFDFLCFRYTISQTYQNEVYSRKIEIKATVMSGDPATLEKAHSYFGQHKGVDLKIQIAEYIDVPYQEDPKCWKCGSALAFPYYWLRWEEGNKFGCKQCVEAKSTQEGHHYAYEQNSVLLVGKWDKIAVKNLGKNKQPADTSKVEDGHGYGCNCCGGCSGQIGEARYICLGCRADPNPKGDYVDVCLNCIEKVLSGDEQTLQGLKPDNHVNNHPWLRVLYNTSGYYEF